ncbi:MAG: T9SS type A sorting domain-containing protein [Rhodothermales bacterium]|nr:T9SS type A sorting domain-containing protein [Rhodothermales bacterium]
MRLARFIPLPVRLLLGLLLYCQTAEAQSVEWTAVRGPEGAVVSSIESWDDRDAVILRTSRGWTYRSDDRMRSWTALGSSRYHAFAGPDTVVSALGSKVSMDGGLTWLESPIPDSIFGRTAAISRRTGTVVLASRTELARWTIGSQEAKVFDERDITSLTWTGNAFLATLDADSERGPYLISSDDGLTWLPGVLPAGRFGLEHPIERDGTLWAVSQHTNNRPSILRSTDGGFSWQHDRTLGCGASSLVDVLDTDLILAAGAILLAVGRSGGPCRTLISRGRITYPDGAGSSISRASYATLEGGLIAMADRGQLRVSRDSGQTWDLPQLSGVHRSGVTTIHADPRDGSWWVGTETSGLFRSRDGGINWDYLGFRGSRVPAIATGRDPREVWAAVDHTGLHRSIDDGLSWSSVRNNHLDPEQSNGIVRGLEWSAETQSVLATWSIWDVFSSPDGAEWTPFGVPARSRIDPPIWGSHLAQTGWLYVAMLYPMSNEWEVVRKQPAAPASAWEKIGGDLPGPAAAFLEDKEGRVYAGVPYAFDPDLGPAGVYRVSPPDTSWTLIHRDSRPESLLRTPDGSLWALQEFGGLLRSTDGVTFTNAGTGLPDCLESITYDPFWREVLVGTCHNGLFSLALRTAVFTGPEESSATQPGVFPNPSRGTITVSFPHSGGSYSIAVFDLLGRRIAFEMSSASGPDVYHTLDLSRVSAGTHFVRVESGHSNTSKSFVVVR